MSVGASQTGLLVLPREQARPMRMSSVLVATAVATLVLGAAQWRAWWPRTDVPEIETATAAMTTATATAVATPLAPLPSHLSGTGLYADPRHETLAAGVRAFSPQYPLWTDGATKRRYILLPPGTSIDGSAPNDWAFPVGTRLWKEFSFGRRVETRYMERTSTGWRYATYAWDDAQTDAELVGASGRDVDVPWPEAHRHRIPSESECRACHDSGPTPVLGFSALQLSPDRDPNALHAEPLPADALQLDELVAQGLLTGWDAEAPAPRIHARDAVERSALGYLHGNCGGCHRPGSPIATNGMILAHAIDLPPEQAPARTTTIDRPTAAAFRGSEPTLRIAPGRPVDSILLTRVGSRAPALQMPPLGTALVDEDAVVRLTQWIESLPTSPPSITDLDLP